MGGRRTVLTSFAPAIAMTKKDQASSQEGIQIDGLTYFICIILQVQDFSVALSKGILELVRQYLKWWDLLCWDGTDNDTNVEERDKVVSFVSIEIQLRLLALHHCLNQRKSVTSFCIPLTNALPEMVRVCFKTETNTSVKLTVICLIQILDEITKHDIHTTD